MWGAAERLCDEVGAPIRLHDQAEHNRSVSSARAEIGDDAFDQAWREGKAMTIDDAVRYALTATLQPIREPHWPGSIERYRFAPLSCSPKNDGR